MAEGKEADRYFEAESGPEDFGLMLAADGDFASWCAGSGAGTPICDLAAAIGKKPLSCVLAVAQEAGCGKTVDPCRAAKAWEAYKAATGWKPLPVASAVAEVTKQVGNYSGLTILFTYLPLFVIGIFVIWGLVGLRIMRWGMGFFLTILLVFFLYLMSLGYRSALQQWLKSKVGQGAAVAQRAQDAVLDHLSRAPTGVLTGVCAYAGCPWACGATGATGAGSCQMPNA